MERWQALISYVQQHQCEWSMHPDEGEWGIHQMDDPPHNRLLGPVFSRGETAGLVSLNGEVQCSWGDTDRPDMTFSVTKTYLAMLVGVAVEQGLIHSVNETVRETLARHQLSNNAFIDRHNSQITWKHFLQFTSEWQGVCFGIPDQIDHHRQVSMQPGSSMHPKGKRRDLREPGAYWEYNDIRINQCALELTRLFDCALPEVLSRHIMQPLGASDQWRWHGYQNSQVALRDGTPVYSVPGGGHWGGGMVISVADQYRLAQLLINRGRWQNSQLLSEDWVRAMTTPCDLAPWYGYFLWLNCGHCVSKVASERSYFAMGIGGQLIWHDPAINLIAIFRWIDTAYTEEILATCMKLLKSQ